MSVTKWRDLKGLVSEVRRDRMTKKVCPSAQPSVSIPKVLREIIETDYFRKDYEDVTASLLNEDVSYESAICAVKEIADDELFS